MADTRNLPQPPPPDPERPPFFARWSGMYALVLGALAVTLALFVLLTRLYDRAP